MTDFKKKAARVVAELGFVPSDLGWIEGTKIIEQALRTAHNDAIEESASLLKRTRCRTWTLSEGASKILSLKVDVRNETP